MKAWYLVYCKPRSEARAQQNLALQHIETYLPTYPEESRLKGQVTVKRKSLFPNYLFAYFDPHITSVSKIHNTRGVVRIVGCKELMTPIDDSVIHAIKSREHTLVSDTQLNSDSLKQADEFKPGDKVKVICGALTEVEGIFEEANGEKRCFILFDLMGNRRRIEVERSALRLNTYH